MSQMSSVPLKPEFLVIGRILGTFGWAGEIKVRPETDFPQRFRDLDEVWIECPDKELHRHRVEYARVHPRQIRLKLAEYQSKEAAAELLNCLVLIPAENAVSLPEGHYYMHQIIGLNVFTAGGKNLGRVTEVIRNPANDVYVTPLVDIPARKEFVRTIDLQKGIIIIEESLAADISEPAADDDNPSE